jgi:hypothetical protein
VTELQDIFNEYTRMRKNGLASTVALHALKTFIEPLKKSEREQLAQLLRSWEAGEISGQKSDTQTQPSATEQTQPTAPPGLRSLLSQLPAEKPAEPINTQIRKIGSTTPQPQQINESSDLGELQGRFDTHTLVDENTRVSQDFFGASSILILQVRGTNQAFEVRPQQYTHDIVVGRGSAQSAMHPDIDLEAFEGTELGVSRLHISMRYDSEHNAIHIYDLGSSNGSYLNNQRLNPHEVRFLRDGDQLRLGRMVMQVKFKHMGL